MPTGPGFDPAQPLHGCAWRKFAALRGFVDFNHVYRPPPSNANSPALDAVAVARATLVAPADTKATLTLAWDDQLVLRVNDGEPLDLGVQPYVRAKTVDGKRQSKWILHECSSSYPIGDFNGREFFPTAKRQKTFVAGAYLAPYTFDNAPERLQRRRTLFADIPPRHRCSALRVPPAAAIGRRGVLSKPLSKTSRTKYEIRLL